MSNDLINRASCKKLAVRWAAEHRNGWLPTRVSKQFLDDVNAKVRLLIQQSINKHRSVGKTIKDFF